MNKVLVISNDVVDQKMAGVGVRNWEIANALARSCEVTLAIPNAPGLQSTRVKLIQYDPEKGDLRDQAGIADALVLGGSTLHFHPYLREMGKPIAVDLYVPSLLESLVWHEGDDLVDWMPRYEEYLRVQLELLRAGDFFFCANESQHDYWLGFLHAQKRINPHTYAADHTLRRLIDVVPYGLPEAPIPERQPVLKGIHPGIPANAFLILWNGGLWDWLDPLTLIKAMALLDESLPQARLYFLGFGHPNPRVQNMNMPEKAIRLSQELGLFDRKVFFGDWTPYQQRGQLLREADLSAVLYGDHIETRFSFRTRLLDCIWAGLSVVTSGGDELSDKLVRAGLGIQAPYGDEKALAEIILSQANRGKSSEKENAWKALRDEFRWSKVTAPLAEFCAYPHLAEDKGMYLTDLERISRDKDAFHEKVVREMDQYLAQVIHDKDAFLEQVIHDKDAFLEQVIHDKDAFLEQVIHDRDASLEQVIHDKDAVLEQTVREKEAVQESLVLEKDSKIAKAIAERDELQATLDHYRRLLPFRVYRSVRKALSKKS